MDTKEEVRERIDIVDLIGEYVDLKRAGRSYKGLSPFKAEKTPSFMVSPDKQIWYDFSTNQGGDAFSFIMKVEGMEFRQALEFLAKKVGVEIAESARPGEGEKRKRLQAANAAATHFFQKHLLDNKQALEYLRKQRGLTKQIILDFGLGYAPDSYDALPRHLSAQGFSIDEQIDAGLCRKGQRSVYSIFRHRIMVPLKDRVGQSIGFTGRLLDGDSDGSKYMNTPQTLIYDKGRHVYGLDAAKDTIVKEEFSVMVEGNFDVISSHMAGVTNCVATAGTAMTISQIKTLSKLGSTIKIAYDNDSAGLAATERAVTLAAGEVDLHVVTIEDAKDADELIARDPQEWIAAVDQSRDAFEWVVDSYISSGASETARGKQELSAKLAELLKPIKDPVIREHYIEYVADNTSISSTALKEKLAIEPAKRRRRVKNQDQEDEEVQAEAKPAYNQAIDRLVSVMCAGARPPIDELKQALSIASDEQTQVIEHITAGASGEVDLKSTGEYGTIQSFHAQRRYEGWNTDQLNREASMLIKQIDSQYTVQRKSDLIKQLTEAEATDDETKINEIIKQIQSINK